MKNYNLKLKIILIFAFCLLASSANATTVSLYLSPSSANYIVDNTFSVAVRINSVGVSVNAAEGTLVFNPDELQVVNVSKSNSIFSLWTTEPSFSNSSGNIFFAGGTPTNFVGNAGKVITITFKAKITALAQVNFSSGSILAADGKGTNILGSMRGGNYNLSAQVITPSDEEPPVTPYQAPAAPVISSVTHSDENKWYSNINPEFIWKLPSDVTEVSLLLHKKPTGDPGSISDGLMESKKFEDIKDGIWYFHIKFKNEYGWGKITHRKVSIDTQPPKPFEIEQVQREDPTDPQPVLIFETADELSGIEYYRVKINDEEGIRVDNKDGCCKTKPYRLISQAPGIYQIEIKAFDRAGNYSKTTTEIEILPIETPTITEFPKSLSLDQNLILKGKSLPDVRIKVFIQKEKRELTVSKVKSNEYGEWLFISGESLDKGDYQVWVQVQDERGALSLTSPKISFWVTLSPIFRFGKIVIDYLSIMITLIVLIVAAVIIIFYGWYRISRWRKRLKIETKEVTQTVAKSFRTLREEIQEEIEKLDKKPGLSKREKQIRDKLQKAIDSSEELIEKEIKDIKKELER